MKFKILEELKLGLGKGQVYKVLYKNNTCILKVYDFKENETKINNEINFIKAVKNIPHFLQIKDHGELKCSDIKSFHKTSNRQNLCKYIIFYPFLDYTLNDVRNTIKEKEYLQMLYQIINVVKKVKELGWIHGDIHGGNIMFKNNKWYIIDYEYATKIKDSSLAYWREDNLLMFLTKGVVIYNIDKIPFSMYSGKIKYKNVAITYSDFFNNLYNHPKYDEIKNYVPVNVKDSVKKEYTFTILCIKYYDVLLECSGLDKFSELKSLGLKAKFCPILLLNIIKYVQDLDMCLKKINYVIHLKNI